MRTGIISSVLLGVAMMSPIALRAQDGDHHHGEAAHQQRYYDKQGKDWHNWDDNQNKMYQRYVEENHRQNRDFAKLSKKQQNDYFRWQHQHEGDHH